MARQGTDGRPQATGGPCPGWRLERDLRGGRPRAAGAGSAGAGPRDRPRGSGALRALGEAGRTLGSRIRAGRGGAQRAPRPQAPPCGPGAQGAHQSRRTGPRRAPGGRRRASWRRGSGRAGDLRMPGPGHEASYTRSSPLQGRPRPCSGEALPAPLMAEPWPTSCCGRRALGSQ